MGKANFISVNTIEDLDLLIESSSEKPVVLFKHSTTCPISHSVYRTVSGMDADIHLVVVQEARNVSNAIAQRTGIRHESPQAIVLSNGKSAYNSSHYDIEAKQIEKYLND